MAVAAKTYLICCLVLSRIVPSPHVRSGQPPCSAWRSQVAQRIIQQRWLPIVRRYNVSVPVTCPLHSARHLPSTGRTTASTRRRGSGWRCALCGKVFLAETTLEHHYRVQHHPSMEYQDETLVCPAEMCGILRCSVYRHVLGSERTELQTTDGSDLHRQAPPVDDAPDGTQRAVQTLGPRQLRKYAQPLASNIAHRWQCDGCLQQRNRASQGLMQCERKAQTGNESAGNVSDMWARYLWWWTHEPVPSDGDETSRDCEEEQAERDFTAELCDAAKMKQLRVKCEDLVSDCLSPLILSLTPEEYHSMQEELLAATCWYLACGRYWARGPAAPRTLPWGYMSAALAALTLLLSCCYYRLCGLHRYKLLVDAAGGDTPDSTCSAVGADGDAFIQVQCPQELKERLLERTLSREPTEPHRPNHLFAIYDGEFESAPPNHVDY